MTTPSTARRATSAVALTAALALSCGGGDQPGASTPRTPAAQFDDLWADFDRTYPYFVEKDVDWDAARLTFRARAAAAATEAELAGILGEMLTVLEDQHVALLDPSGRWVPTWTPTRAPNFDAAVLATYASRWSVVADGTWSHGHIGAVPYAVIRDWSAAPAHFDAWLDSVRDAPGLVLDVRMNPGGNNQYALQVAGRFADATRVAGLVRTRNGPSHGDLGPAQAMRVSPAGSWQFTKPVLLLVGARSVSSTEDFASAMRELPHVTLVGDTTGGASANPARRSLESGWGYTVSTWFFTTPDGLVVEGHGIPPHVAVAAAPADFAAGVDPVLDWAETWAAQPKVARP
ncbi:MAG: S41 family peptidase [Anaeromyxobacter sp.]